MNTFNEQRAHDLAILYVNNLLSGTMGKRLKPAKLGKELTEENIITAYNDAYKNFYERLSN